MARIPDDEIERLKRETDLAGLVRMSGVELSPHGAGGDLIGRCPLHDDKTPSLVVTPAKDGKPSLWHCLGACGIGGSAIDWIMRMGISMQSGTGLAGKTALVKQKRDGTRLVEHKGQRLECRLVSARPGAPRWPQAGDQEQ